MKHLKVCALAIAIASIISCSKTKDNNFVFNANPYPLHSNSSDSSVVFYNIKNGKAVSGTYLAAYPFYNDLAIVKTASGWSYINKDFNHPINDHFLEATHFSEGIAFTVKAGGQITAIDKNGNTRYTLPDVEAVYAMSEERAVFQDQNGKFGLLDKKGEIICLAKYDDCEYFMKDGTMMVMLKGSNGRPQWGIVDRNGDELIPIKYPKIIRQDTGFTIYRNDKRAAWYDLESNTVTGFDFRDIFRDGNLMCYKNQKGKYGWMNHKGEVIIEPAFDNVTPFGNKDRALAKMRKRGENWGIINKKGEWVLLPKFAIVIPTDSHPIVGRSHNELGVIDLNGKILIRCNKSAIKHLTGNYYLVTTFSNKTGIMKADGKETWKKEPTLQSFSGIVYHPSTMVHNNHMDLPKICEFIRTETSKLKKTTVNGLIEAYDLNKKSLPKRTSNIILSELSGSNYSIKLEAEKVPVWIIKRDWWNGDKSIFNGNGSVKKYCITATLRNRYAANKEMIIKHIEQEIGIKSYKLTDISNKSQTGFKISITIEE